MTDYAPTVASTRRDRGRSVRLAVSTLAQPDATTCGPTCLHAIYRYWGRDIPLSQVITSTKRLAHGGTLAVLLGCDALRNGYKARIYTGNLTVFDPTWFTRPGIDLESKLSLQQSAKPEMALSFTTEAYLDFLALGGRIRFANISPSLLRRILECELPIITGLSSTYLYQSAREYGPEDEPDDIRGLPAGHFVIVAGWDRDRRKVLVIDPYEPNPYGASHSYWLGIERVVAAILLGIVTHDANLLVVYPIQMSRVAA